MARYYYGPRAAELPDLAGAEPVGETQRERSPRGRTQRKYAQDRDKWIAGEGGAGRLYLAAGGVGGDQADRDAGAVPGPRHRQREPLPDVVAGLPVVGRERAISRCTHR